MDCIALKGRVTEGVARKRNCGHDEGTQKGNRKTSLIKIRHSGAKSREDRGMPV